MSVDFTLQAKGLKLFSNALDLEKGSLLTADNVVIDRPDVVQQRRGFREYGDSMGTASDTAKQLSTYKNRVLRHYNSTLQYDSSGSGAWLSFDGDFTETQAGLRIKSQEANGNYYFTTDEGIKKISATGANAFTSAANFIVSAGAPKALDLSAAISISAEGFLPPESKVAYRIVWGTKDANNNLLLGVPSSRQELAYQLTESLIPNFNSALVDIDTAAIAVTTDLLSDSNYSSTLALTIDAQESDLRANLLALASKLDTDFTITTAVTAVSSFIGATGVGTIKFGTTVTGFLDIGYKFELLGFSSTAFNSTTANPYATVTELVSADTIKVSLGGATATAASAPEGSAVIKSYQFRGITEPSVLSADPLYNEIVTLKTYYNDIADTFNASPSTWINYAQPVLSQALDLAQVQVDFTVPVDINTTNYNSYFYQVYRTEVRQGASGLTLADIDSGDEMRLIIEDNPTLAQTTARNVEIIDGTPDSFRSTNLYTNPNSGEGILQANDKPPFSKDVALFKNSMFYINARTNPQLLLTMLGVANLSQAVTTPLSYTVASASSVDLQFASSISGYGLTAGDYISLAGFSGDSARLNGAHALAVVNDDAVTFSLAIPNFGPDSSTANFGTITFATEMTITKGASTNEFKFIPVALEKSLITCPSASVFNNFAEGDYFTLYSGADKRKYYVWAQLDTSFDPAPTGYDAGIKFTLTQTDPPSTVAQRIIDAVRQYGDFASPNTSVTAASAIIEVTDYGFTTNSSVQTGSCTAATLSNGAGQLSASGFIGLYSQGTAAQNIFDTSQSMISVFNQQPVSSGLVNGSYISGTDDPPGKMLLEDRQLSTEAFYLNVSRSTATGAFNPVIPVTGNTTIADSSDTPGGIYYSKTSQPEAVPRQNFFPLGPKDKVALRGLALRDSLFILREDGIYRISGDGPFNFTPFLFDTSAKLLAPDSAVVLNNEIYAWSDQGVVTISDTGVRIISRDVEGVLNKITLFNNFRTATFGVAYDLDRAYMLWLPSKSSDTKATQCYRYNFLTSTWTRWDLSKTAGIVNSANNKLYLGSGTRNYVEEERKNFDRTDHSDRDFAAVLPTNSVSGNSYVLTSLLNIEESDVLAQTQCATIYDLNTLLRKIDIDPATALTNNYFASISAAPGVDFHQSLDTLALKLDTDLSSTAFTALSGVTAMSNNSPSTLQTAFNDITTALNAATNVSFSNYPSISGTTLYESVIDTVNKNSSSVKTHIALPVVVGPVTIYKHFDSTVEYAPYHFGNPVVLKKIREGTFMFQADNFKNCEFAFASDLSPGFEKVMISNRSDGVFGNETFGSTFFGGGGNSAPIRTYIPQQKQRCTFLRCKFTHKNARELYQLYGLSLTVEQAAVESRAYR